MVVPKWPHREYNKSGYVSDCAVTVPRTWRMRRVSRARYTASAAMKCHVFRVLVIL